MAVVVALCGAAIAALGATGVARPDILMRLVTSVWRSRRGIWVAVGVRLLFGGVLVAAASECRFPATVRCLGVLSIAAAIVVPLLGYARLRSVVDWWSSRPSIFIRSWALLATVLGIFLVYAAA